MREVLEELNETAGIRGSMIVTHDGMIVASCLGRGLDEEKVAAMVSSLVVSTSKGLSSRGLGTFTRLTLNATHGKMVFANTGVAYLVVVLERDIDLGPRGRDPERRAADPGRSDLYLSSLSSSSWGLTPVSEIPSV